mmetsp:Transcript_90874/g.143563  ORF Transcript_90874/g.143563 Transcript_90874/m.143563 type:complete len:539 (+) Transcript_90874:65-1681(+)
MPGIFKVLPNLYFAPEVSNLLEDNESVDALSLGRMDGEALKYSVHHYAGAHGEAFGPFALDEIAFFCRQLKARLADRKGRDVRPLYLTTASGDSAAHTNANVMLGAYLVLCENWSVEAITNCLGVQEAARKFPCSWGKRNCHASTWVMTVKCCWEGLHMALRHGWVGFECLKDDTASKQYRDMLAIYDAAWIVPGEVLVTADPVTTALDPNPETFSHVWAATDEAPAPQALEPVEVAIVEDPFPENNSDAPNASPLSTIDDLLASRRMLTAVDAFLELGSPSSVRQRGGNPVKLTKVQGDLNDLREASNREKLKRLEGDISDVSGKDEETVSTECSECASNGSVETVCKEFTQSPTAGLQLKNSISFANFAQECGVTFVIRTNFSNEHGMPSPSYDEKKWIDLGIKHADLRYADKNGGLPDSAAVVGLMRADRSIKNQGPGAMLIHCKGGFGRSVVLACCLVIYRHDVPGSALLGWVRIARPGAVTNILQEKFLMSLRGRSDVISLAGKSGNRSELKEILKEAGYTRDQKGTAGCIVQ